MSTLISPACVDAPQSAWSSHRPRSAAQEAQEAREDAALFVEDAPQLPHASLRGNFDPEGTSVLLVGVKLAHDEELQNGAVGVLFRESSLLRVRFCCTVRSHGDARVVRGDAVGVLLYRRGLVFRLPARKDPAARGRPDDVPAFRGGVRLSETEGGEPSRRDGGEEESTRASLASALSARTGVCREG